MKTTYILCILLVYVFSCCTTPTGKPETDCIVVLPDITDTLPEVASLTLQQITAVLPVTTDQPLRGANVTVIPITDKRFNASFEAHIAPVTDFNEYSETDRKNEVDTFTAHLQKIVTHFRTVKKGLASSAVFAPLSMALNNLASCACTTKRLYLLSDCREHSTLFNAYTDIEKLKTNPATLQARLEKDCPIPHSLQGISVYLIHQPSSVREDECFDVVSKFLSKYLSAKGATVNIQTTLR